MACFTWSIIAQELDEKSFNTFYVNNSQWFDNNEH